MSRFDRLVRSAGSWAYNAFAEKAKRKRALLSCLIGSAVLLASVAAELPAAGPIDAGTLPTGGQITSGQGTITTTGSQMTITQQQSKMIAQWDTFNIGQNAGVTFVQPSTSSIALNRILDQNPSQILGSLKANGQIFLLNPSGIVFGSTARVDVGGIVASSLQLSDQDFLSGNYRFTSDGVYGGTAGLAGGVYNQGIINAADYGFVALIAPDVKNEGTISAPNGNVGLASGSRVSLDFAGDGLVKLSVDEAVFNGAVANNGAIRADGGHVLMTARTVSDLLATVVSNTGTIEANSIAERNGVIVLDGGNQGTVENSGAISAAGKNSGETGGSVTVTGARVGLYNGSSIDASGYAGGGTVSIGESWQGASDSYGAYNTYMAPVSQIVADATHSGNGGSVTLWSDYFTNFRGSISARGGPLGGNGGSVKTASAFSIEPLGTVDTRAPMGNTGEWLIGAAFFTTFGSEAPYVLPDGVFDPSAPSVNYIDTGRVADALTRNNLTIQAYGGEYIAGDITIGGSIFTTGDLGGERTLTFKASRDISMLEDSAIDATAGGNASPLNVRLWSNYKDTGGAILLNPNSSIRSNGGDIILSGGTDLLAGYARGRDGAGDFSSGINLVNAQLYSSGGDITLRGKGALTSSVGQLSISADGINMGNAGAVIDSGEGRIYIKGVAQNVYGTGTGNGVNTWAGTDPITITSANSSSTAIVIEGDARGSTSYDAAEAVGIYLDGNAVIQATNGGGIHLTGFGGTNASTTHGVVISGAYVLANSGSININGTAGAGINPAFGISGYSTFLGQAEGKAVTSSSSNITLTADTMNMSGGVSVQTTGILTIQPENPSTSIGVGGSAPGTLHIADWDMQSEGSFVGGVVIGRADGTGLITIGGEGQGEKYWPTSITFLNTGTGSEGIVLNRKITAEGDLTFATTGGFINNVGADALASIGGVWRIYSNAPWLDTLNGLTPDFFQYNAPYTAGETDSSNVLFGSYQAEVLGTGNGILYAISPTISVSLTGTTSKVYDGTTSALLTADNFVFGSGIEGDVITLGIPAQGVYDNKNVGTGKQVTATGFEVAATKNGVPVYGYQVDPTTVSGNIGTITPASLTVSGAAAQNKVYDASTAATITGVLNGVMEYDLVELIGGGYFASKNVGNNIPVTASLSLSGADAVNYTLSQPLGLTANITPATLTISSAVAQNKVYDASTAATISGGILNGVLEYDSVGFGGGAFFADKNVGDNKPVATSLYLTGPDAGNYTLTQPTGLMANITPAALIIAALSDTKVYSSTTASGLAPTVSGLLGEDTASGLSQVFDSKNAGSRTLLVNGYTINDGNGGNNYTVTTVSAGGSITPAPITVTADHKTKVEGNPDPALTFDITSGSLLGGDTLTGGLTRVAGEDVGDYPILQGTLANANYAIAFVGSDLTITAKTVKPIEKTAESVETALTNSQANQNPVSNPPVTDLDSVETQAATSLSNTLASSAVIASAGELREQGLASQRSGDFGKAVTSFKEAADLLLQQSSLPQAREAIELMKTAELQEYFKDAGIVIDPQHRTRLRDIPKGVAVVYTLIFPQRLEIILALHSGVKRFTVPIDETSLTKEINLLRSSLQRRTRWDYLGEAQKFYRLIIRPVELELQVNAVETVIFMPDGGLRTVPFGALHDGKRFLIEKYAVVVTPSLDLTDPRMIRRQDARVFSAGLTEPVQGFAPLANVKQELDGIQNLYRADRLENKDFVGMKVRQSLKETPYSIVHIATHGNFAQNSADTYLLVWDGRIDMNQLDQLMKQSGPGKNPIELLSLSACETAVGDDRAALGLAGVAVKAGARSALATLWSVSDQAASELVLEFYRELKDPAVTKAEALQNAQLKLMDDPRYRHPYYWSPFLLIGNWL